MEAEGNLACPVVFTGYADDLIPDFSGIFANFFAESLAERFRGAAAPLSATIHLHRNGHEVSAIWADKRLVVAVGCSDFRRGANIAQNGTRYGHAFYRVQAAADAIHQALTSVESAARR